MLLSCLEKRFLSQAELEKQEGLVKKYKEELANREEELDFVREELKEKTEELQGGDSIMGSPPKRMYNRAESIYLNVCHGQIG